MEANSPEQQLSPEELIAQRVELLHGIADTALEDDDLNGASVSEKLEVFLNVQALGLRPEFEAAIRGPEEDFAAYLTHIARTKHTAAARHPDIFSTVLDPAELRTIVNNNLQLEESGAGAWHYFPKVAKYLSAEDRQQFVAGSFYKPGFEATLNPEILQCLHQYQLISPDKLRAAAIHSMKQNAHFWHTIEPAHFFNESLKPAYHAENMQTASIISYLVDNGIISSGEIEDNLRLRQTSEYVYGMQAQYAVSNQRLIAGEAETASELLYVHNVLPRPPLDTAALATRLIEQIKAEGLNEKPGYYKGLLRACEYYIDDVLTKDEYQALLEQVEPHLSLDQKRYVHRHIALTFADTEWPKRILSSLVEDAYAKVCINGESYPDLNSFSVAELLLSDVGSDVAKQRELVLLNIAQGSSHFMKHLGSLAELFADDMDTIRPLIAEKLTDYGKDVRSIAAADWNKLAEIMEYTPAEADDMLLKIISDDKVDLLDLSTHFLELNGSYLRERIGYEKLQALAYHKLLTCPNMLNIDRGLNQLLSSLFDRPQAEQFLQTYLAHDKSAFYTLIEANVLQYIDTTSVINGITAGDNYVDLINAAFRLNKWAEYCDDTVRKQFCEHVLLRTEPKDLFYLGKALWPYIDVSTKETIISRWYKNPAEARYLGENAYFGDLRKSLGHNAMIATEPYVSPLERLCPATIHAIDRRTRSKPLYRPVDHNLTSQYAYHYDLAAQLEESPIAGMLDGLMKQMGTSNNEKSELHSLETLFLIAQNCPRAKLAALPDLNRSQLEALAWSATLDSYSITGKQEHTTFQATLQKQNVDIIKFTTWMEKSKSLYNVTDYLNKFLHFTADGGTLQEWKFDTHAQINDFFPAGLTAEQLTAWKAETAKPIRIGGKTYNFRTTHDLSAVYQAGARPNHNCLHYGYGMNMHALPSLLSPEVKMVEILNSKQKPLGNAILRMSESDGKPTLLLEPLYHAFTDKTDGREAHLALAHAIQEYGASMGMPAALLHLNTANEMERSLRLSSWLVTNQTTRTTIHAGATPYAYNDNSGLSEQTNATVYSVPLTPRER
jgi:hypothetical protein